MSVTPAVMPVRRPTAVPAARKPRVYSTSTATAAARIAGWETFEATRKPAPRPCPTCDWTGHAWCCPGSDGQISSGACRTIYGAECFCW